MINQKSIDAVDQSFYTKTLKKPLYDTYCFSNIPSTIKKLHLNDQVNGLPEDVVGSYQQGYKKVVLILIDGFGWTFFENYLNKSTFLKKAHKQGIISKLTTQFPTSTTSNITTLHTGVPVIESGIFEWFMYDSGMDEVYCPFKFTRAIDKHSEQLSKMGIEPKSILPTENVYHDLKTQGVHSYVFQYNQLNQGAYSTYIHDQAEVIGIDSFQEGLDQLKETLKKDERMYCYLYHPDFDKYCHEFGPNSKEADEEMKATLKLLDTFFDETDLEDTLFLFTADHGQTTVLPKQAVYINTQYPEIIPHLKKKANGEYIIPCGGFRNFFLHVKPESIEFVFKYLTDKLAGIADVFKMETLIKDGLFGNQTPSKKFLDRVGDIMILAHADEAVWWYQHDQFIVKLLGQHGGLTKEEIEIPFVVYPVK